MVHYKFPEKNYIKYFAVKLKRDNVLYILERGVSSKEEAEELSIFFWEMVDASVEEETQGLPSVQNESNEFWNEKIMYSIAGYLERAGYEDVWGNVSDQQSM